MRKSRDKFMDTVPQLHKSKFEKAFAGNSKANALKAKCLECSNFIKEEVKLCPIVLCPLHEYRPYQSKSRV